MSGLAVVGRNRYGVFPLRGKVANPRDANHEQVHLPSMPRFPPAAAARARMHGICGLKVSRWRDMLHAGFSRHIVHRTDGLADYEE